ncbi:MAG TPA: hypothetical protein DD473_15980 [Planctomycetaceae bacterium]|nr:hypothetical protein [Planctomycetaceae bacterium]
MNKSIEIIIAPNGQTRIETKGFAGSECREASQFLENALGQRVGEQRTSEFYGSQNMEVSQHINDRRETQ